MDSFGVASLERNMVATFTEIHTKHLNAKQPLLFFIKGEKSGEIQFLIFPLIFSEKAPLNICHRLFSLIILKYFSVNFS
jgi:hypothetical protein